jgi:hypothetical protein
LRWKAISRYKLFGKLNFLCEFCGFTQREEGDRPVAPTRKGAKDAKNKKFEARNPKFETNSNDQNMQNSKPASFGFGVLDFPDLRFIRL